MYLLFSNELGFSQLQKEKCVREICQEILFRPYAVRTYGKYIIYLNSLYKKFIAKLPIKLIVFHKVLNSVLFLKFNFYCYFYFELWSFLIFLIFHNSVSMSQKFCFVHRNINVRLS